MAEEIKKILEDHQKEIKRHFDVVAEKIHSEIKGILEKRVSLLEAKLK